MIHKHNYHIKRDIRMYVILIFIYGNGDYNILDYNQHQLMKREPTLVTGLGLVFLAPNKKGLRSPILKCKTYLASISAHVSLHINLC